MPRGLEAKAVGEHHCRALKIYPLKDAFAEPHQLSSSICPDKASTRSSNRPAVLSNFPTICIQGASRIEGDQAREVRGCYASIGMSKASPFAPHAAHETAASSEAGTLEMHRRAITYQPRIRRPFFIYPKPRAAGPPPTPNQKTHHSCSEAQSTWSCASVVLFQRQAE